MKTRKILAVILSITLLFSLLTQVVWADETQSAPETAGETSTAGETAELPETQDDNSQQQEGSESAGIPVADNSSAVQPDAILGGVTDAGNGAPNPMSLLPLPTYTATVTLNRFYSMPYLVSNDYFSGHQDAFAVFEVLQDVLVDKGILEYADDDVGFTGDILYSLDNSNFTKVGWKDVIYLERSTSYDVIRNDVYFILGKADQLDADNIRVTVDLTINLREYTKVYIDRTSNVPEGLKGEPEGSVYISELITDFLKEVNYIDDENTSYPSGISIRTWERDSETDYMVEKWEPIHKDDIYQMEQNYKQVWNSTNNRYEYYLYDECYFRLDPWYNGDNAHEFHVEVYYKSPSTDFIQTVKTNIYNSKGEKAQSVTSQSMYNVQNSTSTYDYEWQISNSISDLGFEDDEIPELNIAIPEQYNGKVKVFSGHFDTIEEANEFEDITSLITEESSVKLTRINEYSASWYADLTFVVSYDGIDYVLPSRISVYIYGNNVVINSRSSLDLSKNGYIFAVKPQSSLEYWQNYLGYSTIYDCLAFDKIGINFYGYYYDYNLGENYTYTDYSKLTSAYPGNFSTEDEAKEVSAENIKDILFNSENIFDSTKGYIPNLENYPEKTGYVCYSNYLSYDSDAEFVEIKYKEIEFTVFDEYGNVFHITRLIGITGKEAEPEPEIPSISTGFYITNVYKEEYNEADPEAILPDRYVIKSVTEDSYYLNGERTIFITEGNRGEEKAIEDGTLVYPAFETDDGVTILTGKDASEPSDNAVPQISGVTPVEFRNTVSRPYSAASQGKTHIKNYWITYLTPSAGGSKLFVSAANNPDHDVEGSHVREVFLNGKYNYVHDILIANIGDQELTDISVTLENASGVKLDDYWNISDTGVKSLAPFTTALNKPSERDENDNYVSYTGVLPNVAKIRLLPVDDQFREISGTLTVKANGQEPVVIKLTGIAGVPRITTSGLSNGVKYVPYSSVIMTNNMYDSDAVTFSLVPGSKLPKGVELYPNGEVYGVPMENGTFTFTVKASYNGEVSKDSGVDYSDTHTYTILIDDNTDDAVDAVNLADNGGYELTDRIPREIKVYYTSVDENGLPEVDRIEFEGEHFFHSIGSYENEFKYFFLDGIKLEEGVDYYAEEGSTKITVYAETFSHIGITDKDIRHTLAAEFRTEANDELKDSAQNVYLEYIEYKEQQGSGGTGGTGGGTGGTGGMGVPSKPILSYSDQSQDAFETVDAIMTIVDANGNTIPGLKLELHSDVQYAATDDNGNARFNGVEFGRHTLYVTDVAKNTASKEFTIVSGFGADLAGDIITAEVGQTVHITISYDGQNLSIIKAETEVDIPQEGTTNDEETEGVDDNALSDDKSDEDTAPAEDEPKAVNPGTGLVLGLAPVTVLAWMIVFAKRR